MGKQLLTAQASASPGSWEGCHKWETEGTHSRQLWDYPDHPEGGGKRRSRQNWGMREPKELQPC